MSKSVKVATATATRVEPSRDPETGDLIITYLVGATARRLVIPADEVPALIVGMVGIAEPEDASRVTPRSVLVARAISSFAHRDAAGLMFHLAGGWALPVSLTTAGTLAVVRQKLDELEALIPAATSVSH